MDEVHNTKLSAHFGYKKMHALLSTYVWWPQMYENCVREFAKSVRCVNMLKIAHKHLPGLLEPLHIADKRFGS